MSGSEVGLSSRTNRVSAGRDILSRFGHPNGGDSVSNIGKGAKGNNKQIAGKSHHSNPLDSSLD